MANIQRIPNEEHTAKVLAARKLLGIVQGYEAVNGVRSYERERKNG